MKRILFLISFFTVALSGETIACSCFSQGNFFEVSQTSALVAKVKITSYLTFKEIHKHSTPMSMEVEILEVFKGVENRKKVTVWGDIGYLCRPYLSQFSVDSFYVIAFDKGKTRDFGHENETENDYSISNCGEYWLTLNSVSDTAIGYESKIEISRFEGMYERTNDLSPTDFSEIFQKALDFPDLQQFYHADVDSTRKQVIIQYFGNANHANLLGVTKFDRQVFIKTEEEINRERIKHYFVLGHWVCGTNSVSMQLEYPIEGVTLSLSFKKVNGVWEISNHAFWEE